jgi:hypothetical protein
VKNAEGMLAGFDERGSVGREGWEWTSELAKHSSDHRGRHRYGAVSERDDLMVTGPSPIAPVRFDALCRQQDQELVVGIIVVPWFDHPGETRRKPATVDGDETSHEDTRPLGGVGASFVADQAHDCRRDFFHRSRTFARRTQTRAPFERITQGQTTQTHAHGRGLRTPAPVAQRSSDNGSVASTHWFIAPV